MTATTELDDLKRVWQSLDANLQRQNDLQYADFHEKRVRQTRWRLLPLLIGQCVQMLFGVALVLLGVATWKAHWQLPHLFVSGVFLHVLGVATIAAGGYVCSLIGRIDVSQPVLELQQRLATLRRAYLVSGMAVGLPWWVAGMPFLMCLAASVAGVDIYARAGGHWVGNWVLISVFIGGLGLAGTYVFHRWLRTPHRADLAARMDAAAAGGSLRRARAELDLLARYAAE